MTEVISGGPPERPPVGRAPRLVIGSLAVVAALVVGSIWVARDDPRRGSRHAPVAAQTAAPSTPRLPASPSAAPIRAFLSGVSAPGPPGLRLLAGGTALTIVDAATGTLTPVPGVPLPAGRMVGQLVPLDGATLVVVEPVVPTPEPGWVYLLGPRDGPALVARADEVMPATRPGRFWAYSYPREDGGPSTLVEATTAGRQLRRHVVPEGWYPQVDTGDGLLVAVYRGEGPGDLSIVDPVSLEVRQSLAQTRYVVAATPQQAAWVTPTCPERCGIVVADLRNGRNRVFALPAGFRAGTGRFSPDGRRLAIAYNGRHAIAGPAAPGFVEVLDLGTGRRARIPGIGTPVKSAAELSWSPDGSWLAIGVLFGDEGYTRLGVWPASGGPVRALPGRLPGGFPPSALLAFEAPF